MTQIPIMRVNELMKLIEANEVLLIDVREPYEYEKESIKSAINIPLSEITSEKIHLKKGGNKKLVIQCRSGARSHAACEKLKSENFPFDTWNLEGGILAWKDAGYNTELLEKFESD
jgi:rhodanese-related sulfurtransferase